MLPPGAAAWEYAHYNVQETYVAPGGWQPSQAALAEAEAREEWQQRQEQVRCSVHSAALEMSGVEVGAK